MLRGDMKLADKMKKVMPYKEITGTKLIHRSGEA